MINKDIMKNKMLMMKSIIDKGIEKHGFDETLKTAIELNLELEIKYLKLKQISNRDKIINNLLKH